MYASLNGKGRLAVVIDTAIVSKGSGSKVTTKERDIRKNFVDRDLIEAVILLPGDLFYNTINPAVILVTEVLRFFGSKAFFVI